MRLFSLLIVLFLIESLSARMLPTDSLASEPELMRFYEGCLCIIDGTMASDSIAANKAFGKAMDLLNTRSTFSHKGLNLGKMKAEITDSTGLSNEATMPFAYDYSYARSRYHGTDYAPKGLSRGMGSGCRVLDIVLAPEGTVKCVESVSGDCMIVALAQPDGKLRFEVKASDGKSVPVQNYGDGVLAYARWDNGMKSKVEYTVTNLRDIPILVTIFAN